MLKDEILTSLSMLHSGHRPIMPLFFVPIDASGLEFDHAEIINPIIEKLIEKVDSFDTDEEIAQYFEKPKSKKKLASVLYATQFSNYAFGADHTCNAFSVEQPCKLLGSIINQHFCFDRLENEDLSIETHVKDIVTQQELLDVVNIFADRTDKRRSPKLYENIKLAVFSDRDVEDKFNAEPLYVYPDHFLNDPRKVQRAATKVVKDLASVSFYKKYKSVEDYFKRSRTVVPLINTIINDSIGLSFDEKTTLEGIAEAFDIRDWDGALKDYDFKYVDNSEDVLDVRDEQLDDAYENIYIIDRLKEAFASDQPIFQKEEDVDYENDPNHGYASSDLDEAQTYDDDSMMDEIVLMALNARLDVSELEEKIKDVKANRPSSVLYADHENDSLLFDLFEDIEKLEAVDLYNFIFVLNEIVTHLTVFDEDKSLVKMSEQYIDTIQEVMDSYDKSYRKDLFENSKRLYDDFRSFSKEMEKKNLNKKGFDAQGGQSSSGSSTDFNLN